MILNHNFNSNVGEIQRTEMVNEILEVHIFLTFEVDTQIKKQSVTKSSEAEIGLHSGFVAQSMQGLATCI